MPKVVISPDEVKKAVIEKYQLENNGRPMHPDVLDMIDDHSGASVHPRAEVTILMEEEEQS